MSDAQLCREELDIAMRAHLIASLRGDAVKISKLRDEALTAFYAVISANGSRYSEA